MTYGFKNIIELPETETIFTAENGNGYFKYNQVHLIDDTNHYVYKFEMDAWYMRNETTMTDVYLGVGAHPTLNIEAVEVTDEAYWNTIQYKNESTVTEA